ncbi:MAG: hypothetical protein P8H03_12090 [Emcibacteraceae bacterium]|nr:hypothetical protein [Emcibacteraceae bacterium]
MDLSDREKSIWIELIVSITVSIYYFSHVIGIDGFMDITNIAFGKVIINSILFSIVAAILLAAIFRHKNN